MPPSAGWLVWRLLVGMLVLRALAGAAAPGPATPPAQLPLVTIRQLLGGARAWGETNSLRLQGVVTAVLPDKTYFLQDGDAGVYVFHRPGAPLRVGEWVEVTGHPSLGGYMPIVDGTAVHSLGTRALPRPAPVTYEGAMTGRYTMRLIRIRGRLAVERPRGARNLVLTAAGRTNSFLADLEAVTDLVPMSRIEPGSLVEVTGICNVRADIKRNRLVSFAVITRSAADVAVVGGPPWWTVERMLVALGLAAGGLGVALLWSWTLQAQVRRQTAALRARWEKETELEQRYRQIFEDNPQPMWVYDAQTLRFLAVNAAAIRQYGYSRAEFLELSLGAVRQEEEQVAGVAAASGAAGVWRHRRKDGVVIEVETTSHTTEFNGRRAELELALDVTERRRVQAELFRTQDRFATIFRTSPDAIMIARATDESIVEVNPAFERLLGFTAAEAVGRTTAELGLWVDPAARAATIEQLKESGSVLNREAWLRLRNGSVFAALSSAELIDYNGERCMLSLTRDITERKRAEEALRRSEGRLRAILNTEPECVKLLDAEGRLLDMNAAGLRMIEADGFETVAGHCVFPLIGAEYREKFREFTERVCRGERGTLEFEIVGLKGTRRWLESHAVPFRDEDSGETRMLGITLDITDRKRAEEELRRLSGRLVQSQDEERRRIAREMHDTTAQNLAALAMNLSLLRPSAGTSGDRVGQLLDDCDRLLDRSVREIRTMAYLLHPPMLDEFGLARAAREYAEGFARRSGIRLELDLPEDLGRLPPPLELALFRVLQESLGNVHRHSGSRTGAVRLARTAGAVTLEVRDAGRGLPPQAPEGSRGGPSIGVGIAGMRERLRQLGGWLEVEPGLPGTLVRATLPLTSGPP